MAPGDISPVIGHSPLWDRACRMAKDGAPSFIFAMEQSMANVRSPRPETMSSPPLIVRRRYKIRAALLGTVAALALASMNDGGFGQAHAAANANKSDVCRVDRFAQRIRVSGPLSLGHAPPSAP